MTIYVLSSPDWLNSSSILVTSSHKEKRQATETPALNTEVPGFKNSFHLKSKIMRQSVPQNKMLGKNVLDQFSTDQHFYLNMVPKDSDQNPENWETMEFGNYFRYIYISNTNRDVNTECIIQRFSDCSKLRGWMMDRLKSRNLTRRDVARPKENTDPKSRTNKCPHIAQRLI